MNLFHTFLLATAVFANSLVGQQAATTQHTRPNIVFFLVDDLGWQDISVPMWIDPKTNEVRRTAFNDHFRTPTLEGLAASGVRFSQAYSCAVCSPTRTSILSGQNAARHRVTQWTLKPGKDQSGKTERLQSPSDWRVDGWQPGMRSLPALLQEAGYFTIHAGKAHWGAQGTPGADPCQLGFNVNIAGHHAGAPSSYLGSKGFGALRENQEVWTVPGLDEWHGKDVHLTDITTDLALQAVDQALEQNKPFFLYLAHYAVHTPIEAHDPYAQAYRDAGVDEKEARYASMVEGVDRSLAQVFAHLEARGEAKRTIVLFTSDNGGLSVHARGRTPMDTGRNTHNLPLRAGKGSAYEGGTRVPMIVAWAQPDDTEPVQQALRVTPGIVRHEPVIIEDSFSTVLRWAQTRAPEPQTHADEIDGRDWTELLGPQPGQKISFRSFYSMRPLLFHYPHVWGPRNPGWGYEPHSAMRLGDWKVVYFYQPQRWELYRLDTDLAEQHDLAASHPEKLRKMAARMIAELVDRDAQWPVNRHNGLAEPPVFVAGEFRKAKAAKASRLPLVFVHGWSSSRGAFGPQMDYYSQKRHCLAVDLPGHGASLAPASANGNSVHTMAGYAHAVVKSMDQHGIEAAVIVGHSNGALVARELMRLYPERCAALVSLDGPLLATLPPEAVQGFSEVLGGAGRGDFLEGILSGLSAEGLSAEHEQFIRRDTLKTDAQVQLASFQAAHASQLWNEDFVMPAPVLAILAAQPMWNAKYLETLDSAGTQVQVELLQGSHFQHLVQPDQVHALIDQWLVKHGLD